MTTRTDSKRRRNQSHQGVIDQLPHQPNQTCAPDCTPKSIGLESHYRTKLDSNPNASQVPGVMVVNQKKHPNPMAGQFQNPPQSSNGFFNRTSGTEPKQGGQKSTNRDQERQLRVATEPESFRHTNQYQGATPSNFQLKIKRLDQQAADQFNNKTKRSTSESGPSSRSSPVPHVKRLMQAPSIPIHLINNQLNHNHFKDPSPLSNNVSIIETHPRRNPQSLFESQDASQADGLSQFELSHLRKQSYKGNHPMNSRMQAHQHETAPQQRNPQHQMSQIGGAQAHSRSPAALFQQFQIQEPNSLYKRIPQKNNFQCGNNQNYQNQQYQTYNKFQEPMSNPPIQERNNFQGYQMSPGERMMNVHPNQYQFNPHHGGGGMNQQNNQVYDMNMPQMDTHFNNTMGSPVRLNESMSTVGNTGAQHGMLSNPLSQQQMYNSGFNAPGNQGNYSPQRRAEAMSSNFMGDQGNFAPQQQNFNYPGGGQYNQHYQQPVSQPNTGGEPYERSNSNMGRQFPEDFGGAGNGNQFFVPNQQSPPQQLRRYPQANQSTPQLRLNTDSSMGDFEPMHQQFQQLNMQKTNSFNQLPVFQPGQQEQQYNSRGFGGGQPRQPSQVREMNMMSNNGNPEQRYFPDQQRETPLNSFTPNHVPNQQSIYEEGPMADQSFHGQFSGGEVQYQQHMTPPGDNSFTQQPQLYQSNSYNGRNPNFQQSFSHQGNNSFSRGYNPNQSAQFSGSKQGGNMYGSTSNLNSSFSTNYGGGSQYTPGSNQRGRGQSNNYRNNQAHHSNHQYDNAPQQSIHYYFDLYSQCCDTLYREPKDGMIQLRKSSPEGGQRSLPDRVVPEIELITLIDLSNLWGEKPKLAKRMAEQLTNLQHRNLLNITREIQYLDHHMKNGFLQFTSEAPDHISSWKSFCKRPFSLEQTISIFRQLCEGIHHIHESGLIFRDVHPTRIHLYKGTIKFNLVGMPYNFKKLLKNETFSGHLNYSAPEILEHGQEHMLTKKVDIWSLGCCLYYLYTKRDPFDGQNPHEIKNNIRNGKIDRYEKDIGKNDNGEPRHPLIETLLDNCLTVNYTNRPSAIQLIDLVDKMVYEHRSFFNYHFSDPNSKESSGERNTKQLESTKIDYQGSHYVNRVINKIIPQFFAKKNNNDPIEIESLPFQLIKQKAIANAQFEVNSELQPVNLDFPVDQELFIRQPTFNHEEAYIDSEREGQGQQRIIEQLDEDLLDQHEHQSPQFKQQPSQQLSHRRSAGSYSVSISNHSGTVSRRSRTDSNKRQKRNTTKPVLKDTLNFDPSFLYPEAGSRKFSRRSSLRSVRSQQKNEQAQCKISIAPLDKPEEQKGGKDAKGEDRDQVTIAKEDISPKRKQQKRRQRNSSFKDKAEQAEKKINKGRQDKIMNIVTLNKQNSLSNYKQNTPGFSNSRQSKDLMKSHTKIIISPCSDLNDDTVSMKQKEENGPIDSPDSSKRTMKNCRQMQILPTFEREGSHNPDHQMKAAWDKSVKTLIPNDEDNDKKKPSYQNSEESMTQEMIDLVDNLVEQSPINKHKGNKLRKMPTQPVVRNDLIPSYNSSDHKPKPQEAEIATNMTLTPQTKQMVSTFGKLKYVNGNVYEGQLLNGKRSGNGTMTFSDGDIYVGMWKNDQMNDFEGQYTCSNGNDYKGSFRHSSNSKIGVFHGSATLTIENLGVFIGTFEENKIEGPGRFEFSQNGTIFESKWDNLSIEEFIEQMSQIMSE